MQTRSINAKRSPLWFRSLWSFSCATETAAKITEIKRRIPAGKDSIPVKRPRFNFYNLLLSLNSLPSLHVFNWSDPNLSFFPLVSNPSGATGSKLEAGLVLNGQRQSDPPGITTVLNGQRQSDPPGTSCLSLFFSFFTGWICSQRRSSVTRLI